MKIRSLFFLTIVTVVFLAGAPASAQSGYDIWTDPRGRTFLVDPYTGEIVREVFRERRLSRRERRLRQQREHRRTRIERELGRLFDRDPEYYDDDEFIERRQRRNRGRYLDDDDSEIAPRRRQRRNSLPEREPEDENIARLPQQAEPRSRTRLPAGISRPKYGREKMAALQVVLDRGGFSPGVIDGKWGSNVANAMAAWKEARGENRLATAAALDQELQKSGGAALFNYTLTTADVSGPFAAAIPVDYAGKAQLERLAFTSPEERIAEKFHMSESYLRELNPGKNFRKSGTRIRVAAPGTVVRNKVHYIVADKAREQVRAYDRNGRLVTAYPATIGSASTPSPSGTHSVERIALDPNYTYDPKKNFQQGKNDKILTIPPGPNGPVGSVWIALSKPTYGIHGTPNPETIGKTNSHGCIRLTNWDAQELAKLVTKGVTVEFKE